MCFKVLGCYEAQADSEDIIKLCHTVMGCLRPEFRGTVVFLSNSKAMAKKFQIYVVSVVMLCDARAIVE